MTQSSTPQDHEYPAFSLPLFIATVLLSLVALLGALKFISPGAWEAQLLAPVWKGIRPSPFCGGFIASTPSTTP